MLGDAVEERTVLRHMLDGRPALPVHQGDLMYGFPEPVMALRLGRVGVSFAVASPRLCAAIRTSCAFVLLSRPSFLPVVGVAAITASSNLAKHQAGIRDDRGVHAGESSPTPTGPQHVAAPILLDGSPP